MIPRHDIRDLAVFGGPAAFAQPLHVGKPALPRANALLPRVSSVLERNWFTNDGPLVREFEQRIAGLLGVRHCVAVANGTAALEVLLRALDLNGEVIVPAFTFVATAHAARWLGLRPVFADVDPATHTVSVEDVRGLITDRTAGILGVHLWGRPCAVDALAELARARRLVLLFDAAHAFGCSYASTCIGSFGNAEVFSFHATKFVTAGEGGAVTTNDDDLAVKLRLFRNFGFAAIDRVVSLGTNAKMSEFAAAVGLTSLDGMAEVLAANRARYEQYRSLLAGIPELSLASYDPDTTPNYHYVVAEMSTAKDGITRDEMVTVLTAENVLARRYFFPGCHRVPPYRGGATRPLATTERLAETVVALPTGTHVTEEAVKVIVSLISYVLENQEAVISLLRRRN